MAAPPLDLSIAPTWTGTHTFNPASGQAISATGVANTYTVQFNGNNTSGQSFGVRIQAGSTSADAAVTVKNQANTQLFLNITGAGAIEADLSPLVPATTQVATGLAAYRSADTTASSNALTADAQLTLTFNQTGKYAIEIFLPFYEATLGTGGFQFDLNSGTATVGGIVFGLDGFVTGAIANAAVTSVATATSASSVATSASAPSWYLAKGWINITVAGTLAVRWAQASTLGADPTTLKAGAYFMATKIG